MTAAPPSQGRSKWPFGLIVVVVIGIVVALVVANGGFGGGAGASAAPSSSVAGVVPADAGVVAEGKAVPVTFAEVSAGSGGRVATVPVKEGDTVAAGDVILQLDDAEAALAIQSARTSVDAAKAATARAAGTVSQARANVTAAQAAVDQAVAQRRAAIGARNAAVGARDAAVAARSAAVAARDTVPSGTPKAERRRLNALITQAAGQITQANGQISQASGNIDAATAGIDAAKAQRTGAQAALQIAEAGLDAARADEARATLGVDQAQLALDELTVKAPIGGTVTTLGPKAGDLVQPGVTVARVADLTAWRFETSDLSETSIARVREGAAAKITVDGLPGTEIAGAVESVGGYGASSQGDIVFRVVVAPTDAVPDGLRWNMTVTIEIDGVGAGS